MFQKLAGSGFLVMLGVVLVTWIWGLSDDMVVVQTEDGHCQLTTGERFARIEDRHNPTDVDGNGIDEYLYLTLGKYEVTDEVVSLTPVPEYDACRILIPNPDGTKRVDLYPNVQVEDVAALAIRAIYDSSLATTDQGLATAGDYSTLTTSDATATVESVKYADLNILDDDGTPVPSGTPIPNIRVATGTWQDQPPMFDRDTAIGRLISQSTELYSILAFAAVGGVGLAYFFKRRRPQNR